MWGSCSEATRDILTHLSREASISPLSHSSRGLTIYVPKCIYVLFIPSKSEHAIKIHLYFLCPPNQSMQSKCIYILFMPSKPEHAIKMHLCTFYALQTRACNQNASIYFLCPPNQSMQSKCIYVLFMPSKPKHAIKMHLCTFKALQTGACNQNAYHFLFFYNAK